LLSFIIRKKNATFFIKFLFYLSTLEIQGKVDRISSNFSFETTQEKGIEQ
jgi:hypothetical protein